MMTTKTYMAKYMRLLKNCLEFAMQSRERGRLHDDPERWIRRGIADLDFDPYYFLATGETSPEGWAAKARKS